MQQKSNSIKEIWKNSMKDITFSIRLIVSLATLIAALVVFSHFLEYVQARHGVVMYDPVLAMFSPVDLTWPAFILIYGGIILALFSLIPHPDALVIALRAYALMILFRMFAMYIVPLDPPASMILLRDPLVETLGTGTIMTRDLFFSGHTATAFLLFLTARDRVLKFAFLTMTVIIAAVVLLQHVHYTVDVFAAPFFAYGSYRLILLADKKLKREEV